MRFKNLDLIIAVLVAVINVGCAQIPNRPLMLEIILGLPLVFITPGYTLTQILFCKRPLAAASSGDLILRPSLKLGQPINAADYIILSLGLSMAIDVLVGFVLNILPIGLQTLTWTLSLGLITTVFALLAIFLRRKNFVKVAKTPRRRITISKYILFGLAIFVVIAAAWSSIIRPLEPQPGFTQFWILPSQNNNCAVSIGVRSFESTSVTYHVVMAINGEQVNAWSSIVLAPQGEWHQSVPIKPGATNDRYIEAQLYSAKKPETVYRDVHLTMRFLKNSRVEKVQQCV